MAGPTKEQWEEIGNKRERARLGGEDFDLEKEVMAFLTGEAKHFCRSIDCNAIDEDSPGFQYCACFKRDEQGRPILQKLAVNTYTPYHLYPHSKDTLKRKAGDSR